MGHGSPRWGRASCCFLLRPLQHSVQGTSKFRRALSVGAAGAGIFGRVGCNRRTSATARSHRAGAILGLTKRIEANLKKIHSECLVRCTRQRSTANTRDGYSLTWSLQSVAVPAARRQPRVRGVIISTTDSNAHTSPDRTTRIFLKKKSRTTGERGRTTATMVAPTTTHHHHGGPPYHRIMAIGEQRLETGMAATCVIKLAKEDRHPHRYGCMLGFLKPAR